MFSHCLTFSVHQLHGTVFTACPLSTPGDHRQRSLHQRRWDNGETIPFATSPSLLSPGWRRNNLSKLPQPGNNWRNINGNCRPGLGTWNLWWEITRDLLILCTLTPLPGCQCQVTYIRLVKWLFAQVCWRKSGRGDWRLKSQWVRCQNTSYRRWDNGETIPFAASPSLLSPGWRRNNLSKLPQPGNNWRNINGNCRPGLGTWNLWWEITRDLLILCTLTPLPGCQCQVTYIRLVKWLFAQVCWRKSGRGDWRLKSQWVRCQNTSYLVPSPLQVLKAHSALMNMCAVILISLPTASSMGRRSSTSAHMTWWQPR